MFHGEAEILAKHNPFNAGVRRSCPKCQNWSSTPGWKKNLKTQQLECKACTIKRLEPKQ